MGEPNLPSPITDKDETICSPSIILGCGNPLDYG